MERLTEREIAALRLLASGYDVKSAAAELGVSVHSINERLRDARRKLGVSSSREAARLWADTGRGLSLKGETPQEICPEETGLFVPLPAVVEAVRSGRSSPDAKWIGVIIAVTIAVLAALLIGLASRDRPPPAPVDAPHVVETSPADGATIEAGRFNLVVTFDRPMRANSYSFVQLSADSYPDCGRRVIQSADGRSFTLRCTGQPGRSYRVGFNLSPYTNFASADGTIARPFQIAFRSR